MIPKGLIHQLTKNSNLNHFKANEIYRNHLKEETNKKEATKDAINVPKLTTRVDHPQDTRNKKKTAAKPEIVQTALLTLPDYTNNIQGKKITHQR